MQCIRRAVSEDASEIQSLRIAAFSSASEFKLLQPQTLEWSEKDEKQIVLAAWSEEGRALSTTRGDLFVYKSDAITSMECSFDIDESCFPALCLGKGATRLEYNRQGFHSALRFCFFEAAIQTPIKSILGIVYKDAPRTRLMARIGYDFLIPSRTWYTDLDAHRQTLIAVIKRSQFESALESLRETVRGVLNTYPLLYPQFVNDLNELTNDQSRAIKNIVGAIEV